MIGLKCLKIEGLKSGKIGMLNFVKLSVFSILQFFNLSYLSFAIIVWSPVVLCPIFTHTSEPMGR